MSPKGKERATSDSDSDDLEYFSFAKKTRTKRAARARTPPRPRSPTPDDHDILSSDEYEPASERLARRKKKPKPKPRAVQRPRIEARIVKDVSLSGHIQPEKPAPIIEEEDPVEKMKRELEAEFEVPALSLSQQAFIKATVAQHCAHLYAEVAEAEHDLPDSESGLPVAARPHVVRAPSMPLTAAVARSDEGVRIVIQMVADPARREAGHSERAIAQYEKKRLFKVNRRDPLTRLLNDLSDRISHPASDLVLEHKGSKLFYHSQSPFDLGIRADDQVEMLCYEKAVWDKVKGGSAGGERKRTRSGGSAPASASASQPSGSSARTMINIDDGDDGKAANPAPIAAAELSAIASAEPAETAEPEVAKIVLKLRGKGGEANLAVKPSVTARLMLKSYARKLGLAKGQEANFRLSLDGEAIAPDTQVKDMDVETGDMLEVEPA